MRMTRAPISRVSREAKLPLSMNQKRLWFIDQLEPNTAFNLYRVFRIKGSLNIALLKQSLNEIVRRHEALRTTFTAIDGEPPKNHPSPRVKTHTYRPCDIADATEREKGREDYNGGG
jgi:hypothetical protein